MIMKLLSLMQVLNLLKKDYQELIMSSLIIVI